MRVFLSDHLCIDIQDRDGSRYREIVLELRDLFSDEFVDGSNHAYPVNTESSALAGFVRVFASS